MPCFYLVWIFIVVPLVELWLLFQVGARIGPGPTIGLVIVTGTVGLILARWQGLRVLRAIREDAGRGVMPAPHLMDGVMILLAGAVLMTPGLITDIFGLLLLAPPFRKLIRAWLRRRIEESIKRGSMRVHVNMGNMGNMGNRKASNDPLDSGGRPGDKPIVDTDYREVD